MQQKTKMTKKCDHDLIFDINHNYITISIFNFNCDAKITQFIILMSKFKIFNSIKLKHEIKNSGNTVSLTKNHIKIKYNITHLFLRMHGI